ncbi:winged helix-turn-helix domain-containing protein [Actinomadura sp. ATCC 31491]|uniref:Winged helix-turn-helix domain-containing protein n=1 Tax=Actinomadura luzonensis TaxID=2805427 RepID=A0ABT0G1X3_9ACTN|nr:BTAD domain-containing putative transcriptional regulator [Actinomadura luzonensis]MCK2218588.1 winged helix-turn-helix domain-containing protein [Actinomadura luzonensis]
MDVDGGVRLRVTLLGAFRLSRGGVVLPVPGARLRSLLVRLALAGGRAVEQGVLADAIWAEDPPADPAHALQALVSRLRRTLGSARDVTQAAAGGGYRLEIDPAAVDALRFEQLAAAGRDRLRAGDPAAAAAVLGEAVTLWREPPGSEPAAVAAVAPAVATRLAHLSAEAVADLADAEVALGRAGEAAARLTALLAEHPLHERAAALLMDALAAQGRQAEALALYERVRETLADALGADPGTALHDRHLRLLRATPPAPAPDAVRPSDRPPAASAWGGELPVPVTGLVGRADELARIGALLAAGRLVTVLGPGGAGKTRLAVEAARRHRHDYRDGAWMIDLAVVTEPAKVAAAVLAGAGPRGGAVFEARLRVEGDELDVLADRLGGRESLLLIDNCEHLIDAVARLVAALLSRCAGLRVLATSREPLAIGGEALVPLGPLPLPAPDDDAERARRADAVRLFAERAQAVRPGFDVDDTTLPEVSRVVRELDGMPLALELAAARLRTMSLPEVADGLSDRFRLLTNGSRGALPRHRTLRAVIDWSWELLTEPERTVAERVSVLPGGVTADSAAAVCAGTAVPPADLPGLLAALVDRSLLRLAPEPGRYRMLETLRAYGVDRLAAAGRLGTVRDLAAGHFAELTARCDARLRGPEQAAALRVIGAEYDNTLAALRRRCDTGDASGAVALALSLSWYWQMFGRHRDAAYWLGEALAVPGREPDHAADRGSDLAHAIHLINRVLAGPGTAEEAAADRARLRELADRLLAAPEPPARHGALAALPLAFLQEEDDKSRPALIDRLAGGGDVWLSGAARLFRAQLAENAGELGDVRADVDAALACFRRTGDRWGQAAALPMRAQLRQYDGDLDGASADLREARTLAAGFGPLGPADEVFGDLRWVDLHLRRGDDVRAGAILDAARARPANPPELAVLVDAWEAAFRVRLGELDRARELLEAAERDLPGDPAAGEAFPGDHARALVGGVRAWLCLELGDPAGAERALARAYAAARRTRDLPILSQVAVHVAALAGSYGRQRDAAVLLGVAARLRGAHDRSDRQVRELTRRSRAALGADAFGAAYREGWTLDARTAATEADPARLHRDPAGPHRDAAGPRPDPAGWHQEAAGSGTAPDEPGAVSRG